MSSRNYNHIFSKLVTQSHESGAPQDILGLLAYGIYKQEKIKYIIEHKNNTNEDPDETELKSFHTASCARIEQYKSQATHQLAQFSNEVTKERLSDFKDNVFQDYTKGQAKRLNAIIKKQCLHDLNCKKRCSHTKSYVFWGWVYSGIIGNASFLFTIALFMLLFSIFNADLTGSFLKKTYQNIEKSTKLLMEKPQPSNPASQGE